MQGFFTKLLVRGLAFGDDFWSMLGTMGGGGFAHAGDGVRWGGLGKLSAEAKKAPYSKISSKQKIQLSDVVLG